jgi:hypothetical protein
MNPRRLTGCALLCAFAIMVCAVPVFAAKVTSIVTCEQVSQPDMKAVGVKSSFAADAPEVHVLVNLDGIKAGSTIKCIWISVDAISTPNYEINSAELKFEKSGLGNAHFSLSKPTKGWPAGNYKVDVLLDGAPLTSVGFSIMAASP